MVVCRYENKLGYGPYKYAYTSDELEEMILEHDDESQWPLLTMDMLPEDSWDYYRCGFISLAAADKWFKGWHKTLRRDGFELVVYTVRALLTEPDFAGQIAFDIRDVT